MKSRITATILGVGTELTTGQITNKNGSWISNQLQNYGVVTQAHLVVPDDRKLILAGLKSLESLSDLIFVTGGLGPTSDDFTRELVSEWTQLQLEYNQTSYNKIIQRLSERGFPVSESQKQQAYFPEGSTVLPNSAGTADGFILQYPSKEDQKTKKTIFVLPGPPKEIEVIWKDHISHWLKEHTQHFDKTITRSWDTLGLGESSIAGLVEPLIKNTQNFLQVGYRVHLPYVEVKISFLESQRYTGEAYLSQIEKALAPHTVTRDFADMAQNFTKLIQNKKNFTFYDFVSKGFFHQRLSQHLRSFSDWMWKQAQSDSVSQEKIDVDFFTDEENFIALLPITEYEVLVIGELNGRRLHQPILISDSSPLHSKLMAERRLQYFAEMALIKFTLYYQNQ